MGSFSGMEQETCYMHCDTIQLQAMTMVRNAQQNHYNHLVL